MLVHDALVVPLNKLLVRVHPSDECKRAVAPLEEGDDPDLANHLRIEERELEAGGGTRIYAPFRTRDEFDEEPGNSRGS